MKDIVRLLSPLLEEGWYWGEDGRLHRKETGPMSETPWIYGDLTFSCFLWHRIFFELVSGKSMVHSHCHDCYKVVAMPRTLDELVRIEAWQQETQYECKCGIEIRKETPRLYGAYWYCRGLEAGLERYQEVKEWIHEEVPPFGSYPSVILKRGCTEFEHAIGRSDKWEITETQKELEKILDEIIDYNPFQSKMQPDILKDHVHAMWVEWAFAHGDRTYKDFTGGLPIYPDVVTYHTEE